MAAQPMPAPAADLATQFAHLQAENQQLRQQNQQLARRLMHLQQVAQIAVDEPDATQLATRLAERVALLLESERALVGFAVNEEVTVKGIVAQGQAQTIQAHFAAGEGSIGWVLQHNEPFVCNSAGHPHLATSFHQQWPCRQVLTVPINNHQGHVLGVIEWHNRPLGSDFTAADVQLAQALAVQVAPAVERAQFYDRLQQWIFALSSLFAFNAALNRQLNPPVLMRQLVEHAAGLLRANSGLAGLSTGETLQCIGYWSQGHWQEVPATWRIDEGMPGWVWRHECTYITNSYPTDRVAAADPQRTFQPTSALCVPIIDAADQMLGFFELHNKADGREGFTWSDAEFMESLANSTAVAIRNARLLAELDQQRAQYRALAAQTVTLLEEERRRIARELHDEAGQVLIGIKLNLQVLERQIPAELDHLRQEANRLRQHVNDSTGQLKTIARTLRPPILDQLGLDVALRNLVNDYQTHHGLRIYFTAEEPQQRPASVVETACYRIAQEALTNVFRHADATTVWVNLTYSPKQMTLSLRDDGCGFRLEEKGQSSLGLLGMRERATMLGGHLGIESAPGAGTTIYLQIPL